MQQRTVPFSPTQTRLTRLTPDQLEQIIETMTGRITFPGISSAMFDAWQSLNPTVREADNIWYEFNARTSRLAVKCATSAVHDPPPSNRISAGLQARLVLMGTRTPCRCRTCSLLLL